MMDKAHNFACMEYELSTCRLMGMMLRLETNG